MSLFMRIGTSGFTAITPAQGLGRPTYQPTFRVIRFAVAQNVLGAATSSRKGGQSLCCYFYTVLPFEKSNGFLGLDTPLRRIGLISARPVILVLPVLAVRARFITRISGLERGHRPSDGVGNWVW